MSEKRSNNAATIILLTEIGIMIGLLLVVVIPYMHGNDQMIFIGLVIGGTICALFGLSQNLKDRAELIKNNKWV